jgi:predicted permease
VAITEAATPTAVSSALMAIEFDSDADFVTSVIFFSTLFSAVTLTILLSFLT